MGQRQINDLWQFDEYLLRTSTRIHRLLQLANIDLTCPYLRMPCLNDNNIIAERYAMLNQNVRTTFPQFWKRAIVKNRTATDTRGR